jgi:hypothetical protein
MKRLTNDPRDCASRILALVFADVVICGVALADPSWTITQLTNYSNSGGPRSALRPDISGTSVVWEGWTDASHSQIYSNGGDSWSGPYAFNLYPAISGTNVIWNKHGQSRQRGPLQQLCRGVE